MKSRPLVLSAGFCWDEGEESGKEMGLNKEKKRSQELNIRGAASVQSQLFRMPVRRM